ncbi:MAG: hypothetical protein ACE5ID_02265 [Acidobacteriota bacterium]
MEIAVVLMVLVAAGLFILRPVISADPDAGLPSHSGDDGALRDAVARREQSYESLADLEMDHAAGKISSQDHARLKQLHQAEAIAALKTIEALRGSAGEEAPSPSDHSTS